MVKDKKNVIKVLKEKLYVLWGGIYRYNPQKKWVFIVNDVLGDYLPQERYLEIIEILEPFSMKVFADLQKAVKNKNEGQEDLETHRFQDLLETHIFLIDMLNTLKCLEEAKVI